MRCLTVFPLFFLLAFPSCQKKDPLADSKQALYLNIHTEPPTLDPRKATDTTSVSVIKMCFEGLTRLNEKGDPELAVAEHMTVADDHKTYTFFLRDATWSDGQPITAYDFEKTWKTMLSPSFVCEFANDLYFIKNAQAAKNGRCPIDQIGVRALDPKTLVIELNYPVPHFLSLLSCHSFFAVPQHIVEQHPHWCDDSGENFVCNGPFRLTEWRHHNQILVVKNENYWDRNEVHLETITLFLIEDENTELSMFENGELDWAGNPLSTLPIDAMYSLKKNKEVTTYPLSGTYYYIFNTQQFPFNNAHIRRAFGLAIDRKAIVDNITQSEQLPATSLIPPTLWKETKSYFKDRDLQEARRCFQKGLAELGITADQFPSVTLSYNTLSSHHKIAQAIQEQWLKALGVHVKLANKEWKVFLDELRHHDFQIARMGGMANCRDPLYFLDSYRYLSSSNNHPQWTNSTFTELLEKAELTADEKERHSYLKEAEQLLMAEMPIVPIYFYTGSYIKKPYVKGVMLSDLSDADFKKAYVEKR